MTLWDMCHWGARFRYGLNYEVYLRVAMESLEGWLTLRSSNLMSERKSLGHCKL